MSEDLSNNGTCPICDAKSLTPAFKIYYWRENLLQFADCEKCGACFANPMPSDAVIEAGNDALIRHYQANASPETEFRDARQAYLRGKVLAGRLRRQKRKGRLLELGCYHGFFSLGVKENCDWEVHGLEISRELATFVQERLGVHCYLGTFEQAKVPENYYDFVVRHDLIEHINQPRIFLKQLAKVLAPKGKLQVITPNAHQDLALVRRSYAAGFPTTMLLNHILYFRPRTLAIACEKAGLKVRKLYGYDIRHSLKDFDCFGMGDELKATTPPSANETLRQPKRDVLSWWTDDKIEELRRHPKVSFTYGLVKEVIPQAFTLPVPPALELSHELYLLAEKP